MIEKSLIKTRIFRTELTVSQEAAMTMPTPNPGEIVLNARKCMKLSQVSFGKKYGFKQSAVSKFERGRVSPPSQLVLECIEVLKEARGSGGVFSSRDVAKLVESRLKSPQFSKLRGVLVDLIESLSAPPGDLQVDSATNGLVPSK